MRQPLIGAAVVSALTLSTLSLAQNNPTPEWSVITTTQIKPDSRLEYEAGQKEITAAYKKAGIPYRVVVQTLFGDLAEYTSIAPLSKFADMDGPSPLEKALGQAASQRLLKRMGGYLVSVHRETTISLDELSIRTPMENPGEYAVVTMMRLVPGKGQEFAAYMKDDYLPAMRKADVANLWVSQPVFGADGMQRILVRLMHKMAEIDNGPLIRKALGVEGARQLGMRQAAIVASTHTNIVRIRTDLSLMPPMQKKSD